MEKLDWKSDGCWDSTQRQVQGLFVRCKVTGVVILTNPPFFRAPRTILIVVRGSHFFINVDFFAIKLF